MPWCCLDTEIQGKVPCLNIGPDLTPKFHQPDSVPRKGLCCAKCKKQCEVAFYSTRKKTTKELARKNSRRARAKGKTFLLWREQTVSVRRGAWKGEKAQEAGVALSCITVP